MADYPAPLVVAAGAGEVIEVGGVEHLFKLTGHQSAGRLAVEEFSLAPGAMGARPHVHSAHDEHFYVTSGELTIHDGTGEQLVTAGSLVAALRGSAHGFRNAGNTVVQGLTLFTPAGYENYFRDVHAAVAGGAVLSDELLAEHRSRYDTISL
ncbi:MAG: cupin domain-containing protein [Pseudonocardiales bacterium]|nr:MAG: cupin domain-containing protein [Pseudonocardiales bacterium]